MDTVLTKEEDMERQSSRTARYAVGTSVALALALVLAAPAAAQGGPTGGSGLGWQDAAVGMAILAGVLLMIVWGDVVIGNAVVLVAVAVGACARLVTRTSRPASDRSARRSPGGTVRAPLAGDR
jgi:hypothetical protein